MLACSYFYAQRNLRWNTLAAAVHRLRSAWTSASANGRKKYKPSFILHSNTRNKNISWTVKYLCQIPTASVDYSLWLSVYILLCLRYSRCNSKLLSKINMFCLHIYFNFLLKASWTHNLFYFLSIFASLQMKIQVCFSSQVLPISFIQHSTTISNSRDQIIDWNNNYESSKSLITSNYALLGCCFFKNPF